MDFKNVFQYKENQNSTLLSWIFEPKIQVTRVFHTFSVLFVIIYSD